MWVWDGVIRPEPGECIDDAVREAKLLADRYHAGSKLDATAQKYDVCFSFRFNDVWMRVFSDSTVEELCEQYQFLLQKGISV